MGPFNLFTKKALHQWFLPGERSRPRNVNKFPGGCKPLRALQNGKFNKFTNRYILVLQSISIF